MKKRCSIMKAILAALLAAAMCVPAAALGEEKTFTVGICQLVQHDALDAATQGFKDALTEALGDKVTFDEQVASGDSAACNTIVNSFVSKKVDLILANATPALQAAYNATAAIPILGTAITEYGVAELRGRSVRERTDALIAIAHPDFRAELRDGARKLGYL